MRPTFALFLLVPALFAAEPPRASIRNSVIEMDLYRPDPVNGYYRGTRFDWAGQVCSLRYKGHEFFGQWNPKVDPKLHDSIMGPVEEFRTHDAGLGYAEAKPGGKFIRIGVGVVVKPDEAAYQTFKTYDIVDTGEWMVEQGADWISFTQTLAGVNGYAYVYRKTLRLEKDQPVLRIEHSLRNTGTKAIDTTVYNHNFFVMDQLPTGPDTSVAFAFLPRATKDLKGMAAIEEHKLVYKKELETGESVYSEIEGFGNSASDYDLKLRHTRAGMTVQITGDHPLVKLVYWSIRSTFCPEPYIHLSAEPGREVTWQYRYEFEATQK